MPYKSFFTTTNSTHHDFQEQVEYYVFFVSEAQSLPKKLVYGIGDALLKDAVLVVNGRIRRILQLMLEVLQARSKRVI